MDMDSGQKRMKCDGSTDDETRAIAKNEGSRHENHLLKIFQTENTTKENTGSIRIQVRNIGVLTKREQT